MTQDVDDVLRADLRELAAQVDVGSLDLLALRKQARGRVRRRRVLFAGPLISAAVLAAVVIAVPGHQPGDTLVPAQPTAGAPWLVTAHAAMPGAAGALQVSADPTPVAVSADHRTLLHLTWTNEGTSPVSLAYQGYAFEVRSEDGTGVLGVTDGRCVYWDDHGRRVDHSCPYSPDQLLQPGTHTTSDFVVADVVSTGHAAPGIYRFTLPAGAVVTLTVTG